MDEFAKKNFLGVTIEEEKLSGSLFAGKNEELQL